MVRVRLADIVRRIAGLVPGSSELKTEFLVGGLRTFSFCLTIGAIGAIAQTYEEFRKLRGKGEIPAVYRAVMLAALKDVAEEDAKGAGKAGDSLASSKARDGLKSD